MSIFSSVRQWLGLGSGGTPSPDSMGATFHQAPTQGVTGILELYSRSPEFRRAVNVVATRFSGVKIQFHMDGKPVDRFHPMQQFLDRPNVKMSGRKQRKLFCIWNDTVGQNFAGLHLDDEHGVQMYPYLQSWVTTRHDGQGEFYEVREPGAKVKIIPKHLMFVVHDLDPLDPYGRGRGLGFAASDDVQTSEYAAKHNASFFINGAMPSHVIALDTDDVNERKRFAKQWKAKFSGIGKGNGFEVVNARGVKIEKVAVEFKDLGIVELRKLAGDIIRSLYSVPPELIGQLESSNRATIEAALEILCVMTLIPRLDDLMEEYNTQLLPKISPLFDDDYSDGEFKYIDPRPENVARIMEMMKDHPYNFTGNETRALVGYQPRVDRKGYVMKGTQEGDHEYVEITAGDIIEEMSLAKFKSKESSGKTLGFEQFEPETQLIIKG